MTQYPPPMAQYAPPPWDMGGRYANAPDMGRRDAPSGHDIRGQDRRDPEGRDAMGTRDIGPDMNRRATPSRTSGPIYDYPRPVPSAPYEPPSYDVPYSYPPQPFGYPSRSTLVNRMEILERLQSNYQTIIEQLQHQIADMEPQVKQLDKLEGRVQQLEARMADLETDSGDTRAAPTPAATSKQKRGKAAVSDNNV